MPMKQLARGLAVYRRCVRMLLPHVLSLLPLPELDVAVDADFWRRSQTRPSCRAAQMRTRTSASEHDNEFMSLNRPSLRSSSVRCIAGA
jgi:hypothetical protein